jgi:maleate cis-trans isomerase
MSPECCAGLRTTPLVAGMEPKLGEPVVRDQARDWDCLGLGGVTAAVPGIRSVAGALC